MNWTNGMTITASQLNDLEDRVANKYSSSIANFSVKKNNFTPDDLFQACEDNKLILIDGMFLYECGINNNSVGINFGSFMIGDHDYIYNNDYWEED